MLTRMNESVMIYNKYTLDNQNPSMSCLKGISPKENDAEQFKNIKMIKDVPRK